MLAYSAAPGHAGGEIKDFNESTARSIYLKDQRKSIKVMCREIQLGVASAALAVEHAKLNADDIEHERFGVDFGANLMFSPPEILKDACNACTNGDNRTFHYEKWGSAGLGSMEPLWLLRYLPNMPACHIGIFADARGPSNSITLDEASGNLAVGEACRIIQRGAADVMIAGTTGTRLHAVKTMHAALWDELAGGPEPPDRWCRPFDLNRNGQVVAEGACSLILEDEAHAASRGADVWGTVLGSGASCAVASDGRPSLARALANAIRAALRDANLQPRDVGHVNANGVGTRQADAQEAAALREVFGSVASEVPVTALKSYFGNSGSGCGTLELAGSILGLRNGIVPPTLNYETADPECPLNVVHGDPLPVTNKILLSINVTRMGQASALVVAAA
jgi:3-oxoacyl-[acyl-carrier-protein] synthase II